MSTNPVIPKTIAVKKSSVTQEQREARSLGRNITLVIAMFVVPLLIATGYYATTGFNKDIAFASKELIGDEYLKKLIPVLRLIGEEKNLVLKNVDGSQSDAIARKRTDVKAAFEDLDTVQASLGDTLEVTQKGLLDAKFKDDRPSILETQYEALLESSKKIPSATNMLDISGAYDGLLSNIKDLITHVGNKSNLILDPDLDSYYLMTVVVTNLPINQDRLASIETFLQQQIIKPAPDIKVQAAVTSSLLTNFDIGVIDQSNTTVLAEDPNFYGTNEKMQSEYPVAIKAYDAPNNALADLLTKMAGDTPPNPADVLPVAEKARLQSYAIWDEAVRHLDDLLNTRITWLADYRNEGLGVTLAFLLVAIVIAVFVVGRLVNNFTNLIGKEASAQSELEKSRELQEQLHRILMVIADASEGKLWVKAPVTEGDLGTMADALNLMTGSLRDLLTRFKDSSNRVASAAQQLEGGAVSLAQGAQQQTKKITQSYSDVEKLNQQAKVVLENCQKTDEAATQTRAAAIQGAEAVNHANEAMNKLRENVQIIAKKMKRLGDRSMEISRISRTINEISSETDMAAMNAEMASARAGEKGKEFGVVAQKISTLAEKAKKFTVDIETVVRTIQDETGEVIREMESQIQEVEKGTQDVEVTQETLQAIVEASNTASRLVEEIKTSASDQASQTDALLATMTEIQGITASAQDRVLETQNTSNQLAQLSKNLNNDLKAFELSEPPAEPKR